MRDTAFLTDGAARDLDEGYAGAYALGGRAEGDRYLIRIQDLLHELGTSRARSVALEASYPAHDGPARQVRDDHVRMIYVVRDGGTYVVAIAPVGQSMQALLQRRMWDA